MKALIKFQTQETKTGLLAKSNHLPMDSFSLINMLHNWILALFDWLLNPAVRTQYLYWLPCLLLAVWWAKLKWSQRKATLKRLASTQYWWNASTRQDYLLIFLNRTLFALLGITWLIVTINLSLAVFHFLKWFGEATPHGAMGNSALIISIYSVVVFLLDDLSRFLLHWALHKFQWLWRIHQLHHSATTLTPLTTLRIHPLESLLYQLRGSLVHGLAAGSAFFFLGFTPDSWQVWGATVWIIAFNALGANLRHSPIKLSYGKFEKLLISPSQHQGHHGVHSMNTNYGSILSIWDRLAGSWRSGTEDYQWPQKARSLTKQLLLKEIDWK